MQTVVVDDHVVTQAKEQRQEYIEKVRRHSKSEEADGHMALEKGLIKERIVLEDTIAKQFMRLLVFLIQIYIFIITLDKLYPSDEINYVHKL